MIGRDRQIPKQLQQETRKVWYSALRSAHKNKPTPTVSLVQQWFGIESLPPILTTSFPAVNSFAIESSKKKFCPRFNRRWRNHLLLKDPSSEMNKISDRPLFKSPKAFFVSVQNGVKRKKLQRFDSYEYITVTVNKNINKFMIAIAAQSKFVYFNNLRMIGIWIIINKTVYSLKNKYFPKFITHVCGSCTVQFAYFFFKSQTVRLNHP